VHRDEHFVDVFGSSKDENFITMFNGAVAIEC